MSEESYIKKIGFVILLRRELSLFATSVINLCYTEKLLESIKFNFTSLCYLNDGKINNVLKGREELNKYRKVMEKVLKDDRQKCNILLNKGIKMNDIVSRLLLEKKSYKNYSNDKLSQEFHKLFNTYVNLFIFSTIIPFEMMAALDDLKSSQLIKNYLRLENKISKLRMKTLYSLYEEKVFGRLFMEVAYRKKIKKNELLFNLQYHEIPLLIAGKLNFSETELLRRAKFVNLVTPKIKFTKFGKANYEKYYKLLLKNKNNQLKKVVKGLVAYPGIERGRVRVVLVKRDMVKFKDNEVLVTISSDPQFMPIIKKSRAIITDEGGVACHASIVSRELKIPCIVGTKIATQVFKDGDLVEVNARQGVIRKIDSL